MVVACGPQSAAAVTHHTGPLTDVSVGMLGWSVLQRRRQTPEALEAEQVSSALPPQANGCQWRQSSRRVEAPDSAAQNCTQVCVQQQFSFPTAGLSCVLQQFCSVLQRRKPTSSWKAELCYWAIERKRCVKRTTVENKGAQPDPGSQRAEAAETSKGRRKQKWVFCQNYNLRHLFGEAQPGCSWKHTSAF